MFTVALLSLATSPDVEAPLLAKDLGLTGFEAGQLVRGHLPSVVLKTPDAQKVERVLGGLRARGHQAASCDTRDVVGADAMHELRGFRFEDDALISLNQNGTSERLPWGEVTALVKAVHRVQAASVEKSRERKFDLGRAVLTQGLSISKTVTKESVQESEQREPVLYLFRKGGVPWLTSEHRARYDGLGAELKPGRLENFNTLVRLIRARVPAVPYDERLVQVRSGGDRVTSDVLGAQRSASNASTVDLLAHVVASSLIS